MGGGGKADSAGSSGTGIVNETIINEEVMKPSVLIYLFYMTVQENAPENMVPVIELDGDTSKAVVNGFNTSIDGTLTVDAARLGLEFTNIVLEVEGYTFIMSGFFPGNLSSEGTSTVDITINGVLYEDIEVPM